MVPRPEKIDYKQAFKDPVSYSILKYLDELEKWADMAEAELARKDLVIVKIDPTVLEMCVDMYKCGDKLTAIKWLIEEAKLTSPNFGIKWANDYFESLGL